MAAKQKLTKKADYEKIARGFIDVMHEKKAFPFHLNGRTYFWDGTRYTETKELPLHVRKYMRETRCPASNLVVGNVVSAVTEMAWRSGLSGRSMPLWIDDERSCPFTALSNVVAFKNGLLDLGRPGAELIPHTPEWVSAVALPFDYSPEATCPRWHDFLGELFMDDWRADCLQEFMGYCLTPDISHHKALTLIGPPRAGKGTILNVFAQLTGPHYTGYRLESLVSDFGLSPLRNKLVAGVGEVELNGNRDKPKIVEVFKSVTGGDEVSINEKYNTNMASEVITARFVVAANNLPSLVDSSGALLSRLLVLQFDRSWQGRENHDLASTLTAEVGGIASWAVTGLNRLRRQGRFTEGASAAAVDLGRHSAPLLSFIRERVRVSDAVNPGNLPVENGPGDWISLDTLFTSYQGWCNNSDVTAPDIRYFGKDLMRLIPKLVRSSRGTRNNQLRGYEGLVLTTDDK